MVDIIDDRERFHPTPHGELSVEWINDYFRQVFQDLDNLFYNRITEPVHTEPDRKFDGLEEFADGVNFNPSFGRGRYYWDSQAGVSGEWVFPLPTRDAFALFVLIGYGGINLGTPAAMADLGAGFVTVPADAAMLPVPRAVTQDFANDALIFLAQGVWQISVTLSLAHDEVNNGRTTRLRIYNLTTATPVGNEIEIFVGRNQGGFNFSSTVLIDIGAASIGDQFIVQLGNGDGFSSVIAESYALAVNHVSEALTLV